MRQENIIVIPSQAAATITSAAILSENLFSCSVQIDAVGGGAAGVAKLQASNDVPVAANAVPTNWSDIPSGTVSISGDGAFLIPKTDLSYQYIRLIYTNSGTGTVSARLKALGA